MRADATHRLLLNATLFSAFQMDIFQDKYVRFAMIEANGPVSYMLRVSQFPIATPATRLTLLGADVQIGRAHV